MIIIKYMYTLYTHAYEFHIDSFTHEHTAEEVVMIVLIFVQTFDM